MSVKNYTLSPETWTNLNTLSTIAVGGNVFIKNLGKTNIRIIQSATEPLGIQGDVLSTDSKPYATAIVGGGDAIWLRAQYECEIAVQEITG